IRDDLVTGVQTCALPIWLCPEDVAQQAALCFLETARSPEMHCLNGHLPAALARRFRQSLFRWAIGETQQFLPVQEMVADVPEPRSEESRVGNESKITRVP